MAFRNLARWPGEMPHAPPGRAVRARTLGLTGRLLLALLAFGALPLGASIGIGYLVTRNVISEQAAAALRELTSRQAVHLSTELERQRLILRTITGQLRASLALLDRQPGALADLLRESLPEDGVFDGLRLVTLGGDVLANVALRDAVPHWPAAAPAADWLSTQVRVHREGGAALAYLIAVPLRAGSELLWLEGHVRAEDFARLFTMPRHLAGEIESGVFEAGRAAVFVSHAHAAEGLTSAVRLTGASSGEAVRTKIDGSAFLVVAQPVGGTEWTYAAALPLDAALAPLARLRDGALLAVGILVLLIVLTAVFAARSISTPLGELAAAARRLGRSGSHEPIRRAGTGEVAVLVDAFNRMGEDLERSRAEIEQLHAREMERAQQLASVGELASAVAHEIRNPLTGVLGALELALRRLPSDDSSRPLLAEADRQLRRIEDTTTQLLRYARPPELRQVITDVSLLVERAARVVEPRASAAEIHLALEPAHQPAPVRADPELMVQVLVNLMLNGLDAMGPNGHLTVWVKPRASEVWIGVRDAGVGIPAEQRAAIFKPFYTTKHQGTGLGLSISQQIVTRHGGSLRCEETPGGGATFVITLPLVTEGGNG